MKSFDFCHYLLSGCVAAALLAGCGAGLQGTTPIPLRPTNQAQWRSATTSGFETIYNFRASPRSPSGANPNDLTAVNGTLYGTARWGGRKAYGTVFQMDASGNERVVYAFTGGSDGMYPNGGLTVINGVLYGTTSGGGNGCETGPGGVEGCGTVFSVTTSGKERVLYRFKWGSGGAAPSAGLILSNGMLYGVTLVGGLHAVCGDLFNGCGTVFAISRSGKQRVLYRFKRGQDGAFPEGRLLALDGKLFGTTASGGNRGCVQARCGTIFDVTTSGVEQVLYRFKGGSDGANPQAGLISLNDVLYGTTSAGGSGCISGGCGTVFEASTSGEEAVLYSFKGAPDGQFPSSSVTAVNGALYGTTPSGGNVCDPPSGYDAGTVFEVRPSGRESVVHRFKCWTPQQPDGTFPAAGLLLLKGTLYGTTTNGGRHDAGTVFTLPIR